MVALKRLPVYIDIVSILDFRVQHLFESREAVNPGLGGVRDVVSALSFMNRLSKTVCCFQTMDVVFTKDLLSDYILDKERGILCKPDINMQVADSNFYRK